MRILVGMSGGVDSATTAAILKSQGHEVIGCTMQLWREDSPYRGGDRNGCYGPHQLESIDIARKICEQLEIPYTAIDCASAYEHAVIDYFREEYLAGRTPNPCVRCNAVMKFGLLPQLAREAGLQFDAFATGHYARIRQNELGRWTLLRATNLVKDQSYFLCRLKQEQLSRQLFPLGEMSKDEVRALAAKCNLPVSGRKDSQDFYTGELAELLRQIPRRGDIVDDETGKVLGHHNGYWQYTIGQRRGLGVASTQPLYVVSLEPCANRVRLGRADAVVHHWLSAVDLNWVSIENPHKEITCQVKVRSVQKPVECRLLPDDNGGCQAEFPGGISGVAPGQSAVFYDGDMLLAGGMIARAK